MFKLYDHQQICVDEVRQQIKNGSKSVLLQAATGAGKSVMAGDFVQGAVAKGNRVWFTVPRKQLLLQMANTFDEFDIDYGVIAAGYKADYNKQVQICSMQSLTNRLHLVTPPDVCIIDEAHYAAAQMDEFIKWLKDRGVVIVGLSATPWRLDGKPMGMWYTSMVQGETIANLIKGGHLSDYRLFHGAKVDDTGVRKAGGEYIIKDLEDLLWHDKKRISNIAKGYKQHAMGLRTIAYGVSVADCERIAEQLRGEGIEACAISGKTPDDERKRMINAFADGKTNILVNCDLLTFGFDLSSQVGRDVPIEAMIDAAPTMSLSKQLQKNGRALRKKDKPAIILDYVGNMLPTNHGLPDDDREWSLLGREVKSGGSKERTIPVRQCEKCDFCFPPQPVCPYCGHVQSVDERQIDEVDAIMAEVDKEVMREAAKQKRMEVGKAKTLADLRQIARERGYKPSWVFIQAKLKGIKG